MAYTGNEIQKYKPVEYYVESVLSYTSRYNNLSSIGYAPENLVGKPMKYPNYGDFPDTYMLVSELNVGSGIRSISCFIRGRMGLGGTKVKPLNRSI